MFLKTEMMCSVQIKNLAWKIAIGAWLLVARQLFFGETPEIRWESHFREIGYKKIEDVACLCKMAIWSIYPKV
jgi:hypothetical protein